jgi:2-keto-4-pentenoate hydratase/2-oxohepta-3-ene-1,7-dioic acid hydratase in catechol pathway
MKLATFTHNGVTGAGLVLDDEIVAIAEDGAPPVSVRAILTAGTAGRELLERARNRSGRTIALDQVTLEAPVPNAEKYLGLGGNYRAHIAEIQAKIPGFKVPDFQQWFAKQRGCLIGPYAPMHKPDISDQFDYEGELAIVIGERCRHVKAADAGRVIAGFMVCNDASVRDWQMRSPTAMLGKSFDTHGPSGPWLTLDMEIEEAEDLALRTWVNGELRQDGRTDDFIFHIGEMIEELTTVMTLQPGDILATGTPSGVGAGMTPQNFLKVGDVVRIEIERLGAIENPVIAEPRPAELDPRGQECLRHLLLFP